MNYSFCVLHVCTCVHLSRTHTPFHAFNHLCLILTATHHTTCPMYIHGHDPLSMIGSVSSNAKFNIQAEAVKLAHSNPIDQKGKISHKI